MKTDPRSVLQTKEIKLNEIRNLANCEYWQQEDFKECLKKRLLIVENVPDILHLNLNIDGLPIYKSAKSQFYPILGNIREFPKLKPITFGIWFGESKPSCVLCGRVFGTLRYINE